MPVLALLGKKYKFLFDTPYSFGRIGSLYLNGVNPFSI